MGTEEMSIMSMSRRLWITVCGARRAQNRCTQRRSVVALKPLREGREGKRGGGSGEEGSGRLGGGG
jgi:hypothetical protein